MAKKDLFDDVVNRRYSNFTHPWSISSNYGFDVQSEEFKSYLKRHHLIFCEKNVRTFEFDVDAKLYYEEFIKGKSFISSAVSKNGGWKSFGIKAFVADLYGHEANEIQTVECKVIEIVQNNTVDNFDNEYYGFYSYAEKTVKHIYDANIKLYCAFNTSNFDNFSTQGFPVKLEVKALKK